MIGDPVEYRGSGVAHIRLYGGMMVPKEPLGVPVRCATLISTYTEIGQPAVSSHGALHLPPSGKVAVGAGDAALPQEAGPGL
eukprot:6479400-Amphidinium_carterae.2